MSFLNFYPVLVNFLSYSKYNAKMKKRNCKWMLLLNLLGIRLQGKRHKLIHWARYSFTHTWLCIIRFLSTYGFVYLGSSTSDYGFAYLGSSTYFWLWTCIIRFLYLRLCLCLKSFLYLFSSMTKHLCTIKKVLSIDTTIRGATIINLYLIRSTYIVKHI